MAIIKKITIVSENVKERATSAGGNVNWYNHCGKQYGGSSKILKIKHSKDIAILLPGIYPQKKKTLIF